MLGSRTEASAVTAGQKSGDRNAGTSAPATLGVWRAVCVPNRPDRLCQAHRRRPVKGRRVLATGERERTTGRRPGRARGPRRPGARLCGGRPQPRASGGPGSGSVFGGIDVFASATAFPSASQKNQPNTPDSCARAVTAEILMIIQTWRQPDRPSTGRGLNEGRNSANRGHGDTRGGVWCDSVEVISGRGGPRRASRDGLGLCSGPARLPRGLTRGVPRSPGVRAERRAGRSPGRLKAVWSLLCACACMRVCACVRLRASASFCVSSRARLHGGQFGVYMPHD